MDPAALSRSQPPASHFTLVAELMDVGREECTDRRELLLGTLWCVHIATLSHCPQHPSEPTSAPWYLGFELYVVHWAEVNPMSSSTDALVASVASYKGSHYQEMFGFQ